MGFLDRKSRVIDVVLTERGKRLYANGELDFSFCSFFDDGIDYDPWSTGSLTDDERDELIYSSPMFEAYSVPDRRTYGLPLEPQSQVFGAAAGYAGVPRILSPSTGSQLDLRCDQIEADGLFKRTATGFAQIKLELSDGALPSEGFVVHIYSSGSDGVNQVEIRRDLQGRRAVDPFIAVSVDDQKPLDLPTTDPETRRRDQGQNVTRPTHRRRRVKR